jgi:hypothetical protein
VTREVGDLEYAVADLGEAVFTRYRGFVDGWDPLVGIQGWALIADAPLERVRVELLVGRTVLQTVESGLARPDIDSLLGVRVTPGFQIPASIFPRLARLRSRRRDLPLRLRFAGTDIYLLAREETITVGMLVDAWRRAILRTLEAPPPVANAEHRILNRLRQLRAEGDALQGLGLHPTSEGDAGFIEGFHVGPDGQLWFVGWILRGSDTEFPALLIDRREYPAGAITLQYERPDLAARYVAIIGVLDTAWIPPAVIPEFFTYVGLGGHRHLRASAQTKLLDLEAFLGLFQHTRASSTSGARDALGTLLTSGRQWIAGNAAAAGLAAAASLDRLLMIPGFGCLAEGWAVCPTKAVKSLQVKLGDCVLSAQESVTYFKPRPDLNHVFGGGSVVARAGFVTALRGDLPAAVGGAPLLKVLYGDGSASVHALEAKLPRYLDCLYDSADVLKLYPSLRHERFYPDLLSALRQGLAQGGAAVLPMAVAPMTRALVLRLPASSANLRLSFDGLARLEQAGDPLLGIALIADNGPGLAEAKLLFNEFRAAHSVPVSLFCLEDPTKGFAALPGVLAQIHADRFVFMDQGALLTPRGRNQALESLASGGHAIHWFEFIDDCGSPDRINGELSAAGFGWSTAALYAWLPASTPLVRGVRAGNGLPAPQRAAQVRAASAMRVERQGPSRLADLIDEDLLASRHGVADALA